MLRLVAYGETDTGRVRDHNEDSFVVDPALGLFVVADGVGGGNAGEVASAMLTEFAYEGVAEFVEEHPVDGTAPSEELIATYQDFLPGLLERASEHIYRRSQEELECRGMATTCVLVKILGNRAIICHVGDSRLYLLRGEKIYQITQDHSLARELMDKGVLTEQDLPTFRYRNVILRSVGLQPTVQVDTLLLDLFAGDRIVLCSDGLSDLVRPEDVRELAAQAEPRVAVPALVAAANAAGGTDNITLVMLQVLGTPPHGEVMATERKASFLKRLFLFKDLSFAETLKVVQVVREERAAAGEQILKSGEPGDRLYLVTSGTVEVVQAGVPLTRIGPGGHFGELSLLEQGARTADVVAVEAALLLTISQKDFFHLLHTDHTLATKLLWRFLQNLGRRVRNLSGQVSQLVRQREERRHPGSKPGA